MHQELAAANVPLQEFLKKHHPAWNLVGRVHFNLAENRKDPESPFAFLATYTSRLSALGKAQHQPLSQALAEFSGARNKAQLLSLLLPVQRAAEHCDWLREMVDNGEIYHPLRWTPLDAYRFLSDLSQLEAAGIVVRTPGVWHAGRPARPVVKASVGARPPSLLGKDALLDFNMEVSLDGERLSAAEVKNLLKGADGLQLIRGRWVEVDKKKLGHLLKRFEAMEQAAQAGLPFNEALRLLAGVSLDESADPADRDWSQLVAGPWLADILQELRQPEGLAKISPQKKGGTGRRKGEEGWCGPVAYRGVSRCHSQDLLGQGLVRQPGRLQRLCQPPAARAYLCTQRFRDRPSDYGRRSPRTGHGFKPLHGCCDCDGVSCKALASDQRRLRGVNRFDRGTTAGQALDSRDGAHLQTWHRAVPDA
ncbi:SNF2 helicase-associated domain-containing protein [Cupriavidus sp. AcVe19-1a]|uniref:SNF2 helicase-associated domain-containing protein n=1 Tax=Cupriavidus sp. AcVe19-1a TaxID=2821359 RepID=UPI001FD86A8C|nr:SNF2 helicase-associated domain-containing protein [Cupriavidus sp. AcVe19-1a]